MSTDLIAGRYRRTTLLGSGGMGEVWLAFDERLRRQVAVKLFIPSALDSESAERLAREARSAAVIQHANVVRVFDFVEDSDHLLIVMEYVEGETLRARLKSGPIGEAVAIELGAQVCDGLAAAHRAQLIHRDLKPENVILSSDGIAKVVDFGLAKRLDDETARLTQDGIVIGTPQYMAPEQLTGGDLDGRTDVHAAGLLLFELLSGTTPYTGDTLAQLMYSIVSAPPPVERLTAQGIAAGVIYVISTALAKKPADRWQTADAMAQALRAAALDISGGSARIPRATPIPLSKVARGTPSSDVQTPELTHSGEVIVEPAPAPPADPGITRQRVIGAPGTMRPRATRITALFAGVTALVLISVWKYAGGNVKKAGATDSVIVRAMVDSPSVSVDSSKAASDSDSGKAGADVDAVVAPTPEARQRAADRAVRSALVTAVQARWRVFASSVSTNGEDGERLRATFGVTVAPDGNLTDVRPERMSGRAVFDAMASQALQDVTRIRTGSARSASGWKFRIVIDGKSVSSAP